MANNVNIHIYFDNPTNKYTGGDTISGRVELNIETVEILRGRYN